MVIQDERVLEFLGLTPVNAEKVQDELDSCRTFEQGKVLWEKTPHNSHSRKHILGKWITLSKTAEQAKEVFKKTSGYGHLQTKALKRWIAVIVNQREALEFYQFAKDNRDLLILLEAHIKENILDTEATEK